MLAELLVDLLGMTLNFWFCYLQRLTLFRAFALANGKPLALRSTPGPC